MNKDELKRARADIDSRGFLHGWISAGGDIGEGIRQAVIRAREQGLKMDPFLPPEQFDRLVEDTAAHGLVESSERVRWFRLMTPEGPVVVRCFE